MAKPPEMTDPGSPPEAALDATLRAFGEPVPLPPRQAPDSAGAESAQYQGELHTPPKAHQPNVSRDTVPMVNAARDTDELATTPHARPAAAGVNMSTVPRGVPMKKSKSATFLAALVVVLVIVGGATWAMLRSPADEARAAVPSATHARVSPPSVSNATQAITAVAASAAAVPASVAPVPVAPHDIPKAASAPVVPSAAPHTTSARPAVPTASVAPPRVVPHSSEKPPSPSVSPSPLSLPSALPRQREDFSKDPL